MSEHNFNKSDLIIINDPLIGKDFIKKKDNICFKVNTFTLEQTVFSSQRNYEGKFSTYFNFYTDPSSNKIIGFHRSIPNFSQHTQLTSYLESDDGLDFRRPELNVIKFQKNKSNLVLSGHVSHAFFGFYDPLKLINNSPYKAFTRNVAGGNDSMELWISNNNINWKKHKTIISKHNNPFRCFRGRTGFDTLNNIFYDPYRNRYQCFLRHNPKVGIRKIQTGVSTNLIDWTDFHLINLDDYNIYVPNIQMYPQSPFLIGFPTYQNGNDHHSKFVSLIFSRDTINWVNIIDNQNLFPDLPKPILGSSGIIEQNDKFYIYIEHFYKCKVDAYSVPKNRFTYYMNTSPNTLGSFETDLIKLKSFNCNLNYECEDDGYIIVHIYNNNNELIRISDSIVGSSLNKQIIWSDGEEDGGDDGEEEDGGDDSEEGDGKEEDDGGEKDDGEEGDGKEEDDDGKEEDDDGKEVDDDGKEEDSDGDDDDKYYFKFDIYNSKLFSISYSI